MVDFKRAGLRDSPITSPAADVGALLKQTVVYRRVMGIYVLYNIGDGSANMKALPNVGLMLAHRQRRWPNINPTLGRGLVFAGGIVYYGGRPYVLKYTGWHHTG